MYGGGRAISHKIGVLNSPRTAAFTTFYVRAIVTPAGTSDVDDPPGGRPGPADALFHVQQP